MLIPAAIASAEELKDNRAAFQQKCAAVRFLRAAQDLGERALAGAVLADQRQDLAPLQASG